MKDFDNNLISILQAEESALGFLVDMVVDESTTRYMSSFDIPIVWEGNRYIPTDFELSTFNYSLDLTVDKFRLKINTVDLVETSIFLNNEMRRNEVIMSVGGFILPDTSFYAAPFFRGIISDFELDDNTIDIGISNELILWNRRTLRKPDVLCQWGFGETECGYTPSVGQTCNKTYAACQSYSNTNNFGGFRFIQSIAEKDIPWGPR